MGQFMHPCEGEMIYQSTSEKVPYFNAPIYLENKSQIGKVEEILGPINGVMFSVKPSEGIIATSFKNGDKPRRAKRVLVEAAEEDEVVSEEVVAADGEVSADEEEGLVGDEAGSEVEADLVDLSVEAVEAVGEDFEGKYWTRESDSFPWRSTREIFCEV
ncbi:hypothetical protein NDN08_008267 [Rhodosorus marinus]|uniref:H/ACA ribonucleoprotein complex subunit n=1 Tax=Rhodosorus marinus TaxID=101924 RepID=A0AAV8V2Q6_9RHOD|nr:hypothetical protein NDN08_008267 [Rhodosorus marinus]